jgi:hypothetical protein
MFVHPQVKYVGDDGEEQNGLQMTGLNLMDKTMPVRGARIAYSIWDVAGKPQAPHWISDSVPWLLWLRGQISNLSRSFHFHSPVKRMQETTSPSTTSQSRARTPWRSCTCSISRAAARLIS